MATFDNVTDTLAGSQVLNAAILIGGRARRLEGRFKPLLPVGGRTMLARQLEALAAAGVENIVLVGRWSAEVRPPVPVFADAMEDGGSLGALYTALLVTPEDRTIVLAADMPFVAAAAHRGIGARAACRRRGGAAHGSRASSTVRGLSSLGRGPSQEAHRSRCVARPRGARGASRRETGTRRARSARRR
jgi:GTP:adenosylcobinamide-phosphate guanylyltransferase